MTAQTIQQTPSKARHTHTVHIARARLSHRLALLVALLLALGTLGQAFAFQEVDRVHGPVTLSRNQTAGLSVTNLGTRADEPSIRVVFVFKGDGRVLMESNAIVVQRNQTVRLDLRGVDLPREWGNSAPVTGIVRVLASDPAIGNPNIKTTLEVFSIVVQ